MRWPLYCLAVLAIVASRPSRALGEDLDSPDPPEPDDKEHAAPNEWVGDRFSVRLGGGLLYDYARYAQQDDSELQMDLGPESGIRDLRFVVSGRLYWSRLTYTLGYMLDVGNKEWRFRQTGLKLQVPELNGSLFVGRTKEGFSTNKLMVGYYGVFSERSTANDAFIPILADGARWTAAAFGGKLVYNVGAFGDQLSEDETFNKNDWQFVGRAVWLPFAGNDSGTVLHLALEGRYAASDDGFVQYRSKPESFLAQSYAVDTGKFEASHSSIAGVEAYYRPGSLLIGFEYFFNWVSSMPANDPLFHGGELFIAYLVTGETHPYNEHGAFFDGVEPARPVAKGGPGAVEFALRGTYIDLDSELISGGKFWRVTPTVNWYLSSSLRLEASYGYGVLDRLGMDGGLQFFQTRVQVAFK